MRCAAATARAFAARAVVVLTAAAALLVASPSRAQAHAFLTHSSPADGSVLSTAPRTLRLAFSESVVLEATRIDITDGSGRHVTPAALRLERAGAGEADTEQPSQLVADLPALARGAYRVSWQTLSSDDLHTTSGLLVFGVDAPVQASPFVEPRPRAEEVALRWLLFGCLAAALGGLGTATLYRRRTDDETGARRCDRVAVVGAGAGSLTAVALLLNQLAVSDTAMGALFSGSYRVRWSVREAGFVLLLAAALSTPGRASRARAAAGRARGLLAVGGAAAAGVGSALLGHSGSGSRLGPTHWLADAVHLAAAATWSGLLLLAVLVVVPQARRGGAATARAVLRGFAVPAAACVGIVVVTGLYLASGLVVSVDAAVLTGYGRTLLLKVALFGLAGLLALVNVRALHGRGHPSVPARTVIAEGVLAVTVLGLAAALTSGQPAREPRFLAQPKPATVPIADGVVADLQESLALRPNRPGDNHALIDVLDTRRPAPAPITKVLVEVAGRTVTAQRVSDGRWSAAVTLDRAGSTPVRVRVQRPGLAEAVHTYDWTVGAAASSRAAATVSDAPIAGVLKAVATLLAVAVLTGWAGFGWVRRRRAVTLVPVDTARSGPARQETPDLVSTR